MLNIPDSVKALFKADLTRKNFRAHFPNGEFSDITNTNVVKESVHFTESLCSQNTFRFGLAEASVLEFETVGVGNMYGMTIEASIEIDVSSLTAAQISAIQAGTWDGELVTLADSDIGYSFFRVPLGVFQIKSCPRDHSAMTHRKVTAQSFGGSAENSPFELGKLKIPSKAGYYKPNVNRLIYAAFGWFNPNALSGFTKTEEGTWSGYPTSTKTFTLQTHTSVDTHYEMVCTLTFKALQFGSVITADKLYALEVSPIYDESAALILEDLLATDLPEDRAKSFVKSVQSRFNQWIDGGSGTDATFKTTESIPVFYPKYPTDVFLNVPVSFQYVLRKTVSSTVYILASRTINDLTGDSPKLYKFTDSAASLILSFAATANSSAGKTFIDSYNIDELMPGFLEVNGEFGKVDRSGGFGFFALDDSSPIDVQPGNYDEVWWDEYDVSPIGTVRAKYADAKQNEQTVEITIGDGASIYDMTGNALLQSIDGNNFTKVKNMIQGSFATNAANVGFTPVEMTMQGWPWIEAGDALEVTAEDETVVDSYALRVEMSGIQKLTALITADGGEIVGEE